MAISSVSAASNAASAAHVRSKPADSKAQAGAKDAKTEEAASNGGSLQAVHSVVAGALGLEDPKASKPRDTEKNDFYTAGKFLAAAGTIGTIISVLA
jgi:hypothetical protein